MEALIIMIAVFVGFIVMYKLYDKFLGSKIFKLSKISEVPSKKYEDGIDYVPTRKEIIFGHHFTSIAGTGPIVGPAIAIIWGWVPALIWIFVGSVVMGATHDFGSLIISMRNKGKSVSEYTSRYINSRTRFFFFILVFLELWIVVAIFGLVIAIVFDMFPQSVFPVWMEIPIAIFLGYLIYKKGKNATTWSIFALIVMYVTVFIGVFIPINMLALFGIPATGVWVIILLIYAFIASILPVTTLLQPRDFINSHQLLVAMGLLTLGVFAASFSSGGLEIVAPAVQLTPAEAPPMWPFLFITIACGAISGFHSLVSSGTSAKQVANEEDSLFVGAGSMLMEGALATIAVIAVAAGIGLGYKSGGEMITGTAAWTAHYSSWAVAAGLGSKISAFVVGSANIIAKLGIPRQFAIAIMGVFVASFAGTTLDTATRIQRYVVTELFTDIKVKIFQNRYISTLFVVLTAAILAFATGAGGKGALTLWPLFGAVNQTLAGLTLIVITIYLKYKGGLKWLVSGIPALFMVVMTFWATLLNEQNFINAMNLLLITINTIVILLVVGIVFEGVRKFFKIKPGDEPGKLTEDLEK
ncbi:MAG: carbon starvation protein A [Thermotogota bacterium]|nr:carbon starvation protein A [Thermotogota bacterium]